MWAIVLERQPARVDDDAFVTGAAVAVDSVVVVGAGSAGCVLAARLSTEPRRRAG